MLLICVSNVKFENKSRIKLMHKEPQIHSITLKPQLIVFDWDGTLMDSTGRIVSCMQSAAVEVSLPVPEAGAVKQIIGLNLQHAFELLFPGASEVQKSALFQSYRELYIKTDPTPTPMYPGAIDCLKYLQSQHVLLAVATGKARIGLERVMAEEAGIKSFFNDSICADEAKGKPDPDMLLQLCRRQNVSTEHTLMVGDTEFDLEMASRANVAAIGISHGAHSVEQLMKWQPIALIHHLSEMKSLL